MDLFTYLLAIEHSGGGGGSSITYTLSADTVNKTIVLTPSEGSAQAITVPYATDASTVNGHEVPELENGKIPASFLPGFVDNVDEYNSISDFPATGESNRIYIDKTTNKTYRWSGSNYVEISESIALGETSSTAYRGDRGKTAYDHSQISSGNPHGTTLADLNGDSTHRTVTDTEKTAWSGKQDVLTFDNTPTSGSSNPVKSGGVYTALGAKANESEADELRKKVSAVENYAGTSYSILQTGTPGCILYADGSIYTISAVTSTYKYSDFIPVKKGAVIDYILRTPNNVAMIAFYTTASISSYVQSSSVVGTGGAVTGKYTVPADGYVILSMRNDLQTIKADYTYGGNIGELQDEIDTIENELDSYDGTKESIEILQHNTFSLNGEPTTNGFLNASGVLISNANYKTTGYIKVTKDDVFTYRIGHATTLPIICFYSGESESTADSTKFVMGINGYSEGTYTVSANGYVRYCYYKDKNDGYVVFNKNVADNVKITYPNNGASDLTILCLGDSIFGNDGEIATDLHLLSGATTINGAFGGTSVSVRSGTDQFQYFDGVNLANAICSQTWTNQDAAAEALRSSYPWVESRLADLKAVDMSKVDLITMDWGTNDYTQGKSISDIVSAYNIVIDALQEKYPSIRLLIITPIWKYFGNKTDDDNGDNHVYNVSTLKEIAQAIFDNAHDKRVETINMYQNMPLSYNTADLYFDSGSGVHLNATGNMVYAHILNGRIQTMY